MILGCFFCRRDVDPGDKTAFRRVIGWTSAPAASTKGTAVLMESVGQYAHAQCVKDAQMGVSVDQGSLF